MIGVVIVAHGGLAAEYLAVVEHVLGSQDGMAAVSIGPEDDRASKQTQIRATAAAMERGDGVVIVTDMYGGSPSNLSVMACTDGQRRVLFGANLPMLVKLTKSRHLDLDDAVKLALEAGRKYLGCHCPQPPDTPDHEAKDKDT